MNITKLNFNNEKQRKLNIHPSMNSNQILTISEKLDYLLDNTKLISASLEIINSELGRRKAEQQRDEAIKEIELKNRKIEYLKWKLDDSHTWMPIRNISWLKDFYDIDQSDCIRQIGKSLSCASRRLGLNPRKIAHPKLGKVNLYHQEVIQLFHSLLVKNPTFLDQFKK